MRTRAIQLVLLAFSAHLSAQVRADAARSTSGTNCHGGDVKFADDPSVHTDICYVLETFATDLQTPVSFRFPPGETTFIVYFAHRLASSLCSV